MVEKQRETESAEAVQLPAAYSQGGFVQLRTIASPAREDAGTAPSELIDPASPQYPSEE
ncbi:MAG: hypothetical protein MUC37_07665 [Hyphomicrobium sp.]|jgi:hypothetical protein|nr:hypothetical protein [Hyphomicrobium sp.]